MAVTVKKNVVAASKAETTTVSDAPTKPITKNVKAAPPEAQEPVQVAEEHVTTLAVSETTVEQPDGSVEHSEEVVGTVTTKGTPAIVRVGMGLTKNLGNYESLKAYVEISIPCEVDGEEIEETYATAKGWVDEKISDINAEVDAQIGG